MEPSATQGRNQCVAVAILRQRLTRRFVWINRLGDNEGRRNSPLTENRLAWAMPCRWEGQDNDVHVCRVRDDLGARRRMLDRVAARLNMALVRCSASPRHDALGVGVEAPVPLAQGPGLDQQLGGQFAQLDRLEAHEPGLLGLGQQKGGPRR